MNGAPDNERPPVWRTCWRLARYQPRLYGLSMALWCGVHGLPLGSGLLLRAVFDRLDPRFGAGGSEVYAVILLFLAAQASRAAVLYEAIVVWMRCWALQSGLVRLNLLDGVMRGAAPAVVRLPGSSGEAISRFRDDVEEVMNFLDTWLDVAGVLLFGVIAVWVLYAVDPAVTLVVVLPLVVVVTVTRGLTGRIKAYRRARRRATAAVTDFVGEMFSSVLALKVAAGEERALDRFRERNEARRRAAVRDDMLSRVLEAFNDSTVELSIGLVLLRAAPSMRSGRFSVGDLALFLTYTEWLSATPRFLGRLLARQRQASVSLQRLERLLPEGGPAALAAHAPLYVHEPPPPLPEPAPRPEDRLERLDVEDLCCVHDSGRGVRGVDLTIERGGFVVITGRVGSGKTTLLRGLLGLATVQRGRIRWNGETLAAPGLDLVPPRCAYAPQVPRLFSESLADNILLGREADTAGLDEAIRLAVLDDDLDEMPAGLATTIGPRGVRLSGGQVQRTAAARLFARGAQLLVIDDLSSALDVATEATLWERVFTRDDATVLAVSHRLPVLERADEVVVLDEGVVVGRGPLSSVRPVLGAMLAD